MAKIRNTLEFDFQEKGSARVAKGTETVTKAQTRLGQASASAGRQFSAQATGLGGIVSAYAGAAANIFALTAAFFALQRSAEFEQIIAGTEKLASTIGESGQQILSTVQAITKSQLSLLEAAQNVNLGLSAGFNSSQIEELSDVSLRASKALGRNLSDAFQRVVRGAAKLEPELLDELGIFTRIDPAVRKYADSIGVSVTSLTNFERRQAFVNAVIEEGQRKFRDIDTSTDTSAQSLSRLSATIVDLGLKLGGFLANSLGPVVDFISNNTSNAIALFGLLARVVGAQAINVFGAAIDEVSTSIVGFSERVSGSLNRLNAGFQTASRKASEFAQSNTLLTRFGTQAEKTIKDQARAQIELISSGNLLTKAQLGVAQSTLREALAIEVATLARVKGTRSKQQATIAIDNLKQQLILLDAAQKKAAVSANIFSLAIGGIGKIIGIAGKGLSRFLSIITTVTLALSLFQLAADAIGKLFGIDDVDILENLVGLFQKFLDLLKGAAPQFKAFGSAFREEVEKAFKGSLLEPKKIEEELAQLDTVIQARAKLLTIVNPTTQGNFAKQFSRLGPEAKVAFGEINKTIDELEDRIGGKLTQQLILNFKTIGDTFSLSAKQLRDAISGTNDDFGLIINSSGDIIANIGGITNKVGELTEDGFKPLESAVGKAAKAFVDIARLGKQFSDDFAAGSLNAEKADAAIQSQLNALERIRTEAERLLNSDKTREVLLGRALKNRADELELVILQQRIVARTLKDQEKFNKTFEKVFGRPQEKLEQFTMRGEMDNRGNVARTNREKELNQAKVLQSILNNQRDIERDLGREKTNQIKKLDAFKKELKNITFLEDQALKNGSSTVNLLKKRQELEKDIKDQQKVVGTLNATQLAQQKKINDSVAQLVIMRFALEKSITKELNALNKQNDTLKNNILLTTSKISDLVIKDRLNAEKAITKELMEQNKLQEKFLKDIGGLSRNEELDFLKQRVRLQKELAKEQRTTDQDLALNAFTRANAKNEFAQKQAEAALKLQSIDIEATVALIDILKANTQKLDENTAALLGTSPTFKPSENNELKKRVLGADSEFAKLQKDLEKNTNNYYAELTKLNVTEYEIKYKQADRLFLLEKNSADRALADALERDKLSVRLFTRFNKVLTSSITQGLDDLFDAIARGELTLTSFREGFNSFLFNLLNDIRKQFLRETLTQPLAEFGTGILKSAFGISGPAPKIGIPKDMAALADRASGGLVPNTLIGSLQKLAAGGSPRDRVPALLEPGEFVMQRKAVNAMGLPAMQQINAGGMPPISVNINNEGTPQEATEATPRFDVDKIVIDVVTRDLRNNGPIRKSLRGGGNA